MKKGALVFAVLFLISLFALSSAFASNSVNVQKAYTCLQNQINSTGCASMSISEQIFSLLSTGECQSALMQNSIKSQNGSICWPSLKGEPNCDLKTTAQATLALKGVGVNVSSEENWIKGNEGISKDLNWYLEIDSHNPVSCKIGYESSSSPSSSFNEYPIKISSDKSINTNAGPCLTLSNSNSWFSISKNCYDRKFQISCNDTFLSTLLFQKPNSVTYNVIPSVQSSSAGITYEKVNSFCFYGNSGSCDYPGSLWSSFVLNSLGENTSKFIPYLSTLKNDYANSFPDPFLYVLTNLLEFKTNTLNQQVLNEYWDVTGNGKYYDTALALLPFQNSNATQKTNAENWLANYQQSNGCWDNGNIVSNAFILYSLWPNSALAPPVIGSGAGSSSSGLSQCESQGYSCNFLSACNSAGGQVVSNLSCGAGSVQVCCDTTPAPTTCPGQGGTICKNGQVCSNGGTFQTSDLSSGETCCLKPGTCVTQNTSSSTLSCTNNYGLCESSACPSGYTSTNQYQCSNSQDLCCVQSSTQTSSGGSYWWLWALFILVVLAVLGIVYRDKIKEFLQKQKARREKGGSSPSQGPRGPPPRFPPAYRRETRFGAPPQRKIIPKERPHMMPPAKRSPEELNDVLKKLKEIGK